MPFRQAMHKFYNSLFQFRGCTARSGYWWAILGINLINVLIVAVANIYKSLILFWFSKTFQFKILEIDDYFNVLFVLMLIFYYAVVAIGICAMTARRFHDAGYSGWLQLIPVFVDIVSIAIILILDIPTVSFCCTVACLIAYLWYLAILISPSDYNHENIFRKPQLQKEP